MSYNDSIMHVACNIDDSYTKYCIVMLTSLLHNNQESPIHVHILASSLNEDSRRDIERVVTGKYDQQLTFHFLDKNLLKECKDRDNSYISIAAFYRIFLSSILPADVHKVLYLDCDLIVDGSLRDLWNEDISDVTVAAVEDMWCARPESYQRLHYDSNYSYFNSGVMLINLDRMRSTGFENRAITYLNEHVDELALYDQDLLNALLYDDKRLLPFRWNVQDGFLRRRRSERMFPASIEVLKKELHNPVIIHYVGSKKPWHYKSQHPWRDRYFHYLDMTRWTGERPITPIAYRIKLFIDKVLRACGLMKIKYLKDPTK